MLQTFGLIQMRLKYLVCLQYKDRIEAYGMVVVVVVVEVLWWWW